MRFNSDRIDDALPLGSFGRVYCTDLANSFFPIAFAWLGLTPINVPAGE